MGAREKGSALERTIDIHEAEAGGVDLATIQVNADENSTIQLYHEDVSDIHRFDLMGYWECMDTFGLDLMGHWELDEDSGTIVSSYLGHRYRARIGGGSQLLLEKFRAASEPSNGSGEG